ncbi:MAG: M12 family metallo-peptidase [Pseudomonadota bacterium]
MKRISLLLAALWLLAVGPPVEAQQALLKHFELTDVRSADDASLKDLTLRAYGREFSLVLSPNEGLLSSLSGEHRAKIHRADRFMKGRVAGIPGSWVRLNRISGRLSGGIFDGTELYLVDSARSFPEAMATGASPDQTIVYRFADLELNTLIDHGGLTFQKKFERPVADYRSFVQHLQGIVAIKGAAMMALPVTIVSDVQFTDEHGSDTASVVAGRVNFVDGIYASQLGVGIQLLHHEILTNNDVLIETNAGDLLGGRFNNNTLVQPGFRQFMRTGAGSNIPFGGLAHLFTGRNLDGSTVGVAYLGVLCSRSFGYGVNEDRSSDTSSALIFAHELGHNFNSPHDGERACADESFRGIMNSRLNGSQQFSNCSIDEMAQELAQAGCLVEVQDASLLFTDSFEVD